MAKPIPDGFSTLTPHITVRDAAKAIGFYEKAFGATEMARMPGPDGKIMHALLQIGDSFMMLNDEFPEMGCHGPKEGVPCATCVHVYVKDVDALCKKAVAAGAEVTMPVADMFWGDRYGKVKDPFGHEWSIASHIDDPTPEQMQERMAAAMAGGGCP